MNKNCIHTDINKFLNIYNYGNLSHKTDSTRNIKSYSHIIKNYPVLKEKLFLFTSFNKVCIRSLLHDYIQTVNRQNLETKHIEKGYETNYHNNPRPSLLKCPAQNIIGFRPEFIVKRHYAWSKDDANSQRSQIRDYKKQKGKRPPLCKYCPRKVNDEGENRSLFSWFLSWFGYNTKTSKSRIVIPKGRRTSQTQCNQEKDKPVLAQQSRIPAGTVECENELRQTDSSTCKNKHHHLEQTYPINQRVNTKKEHLKAEQKLLYKNMPLRVKNTKLKYNIEQNPSPSIDAKMAELCKKYNLDSIWLSDNNTPTEKATPAVEKSERHVQFFKHKEHDLKHVEEPQKETSGSIIPNSINDKQANTEKHNNDMYSTSISIESSVTTHDPNSMQNTKQTEHQEVHSVDAKTCLQKQVNQEPSSVNKDMIAPSTSNALSTNIEQSNLKESTNQACENEDRVFVPVIKKIPINLEQNKICQKSNEINNEENKYLNELNKTVEQIKNKPFKSFKTFSVNPFDENETLPKKHNLKKAGMRKLEKFNKNHEEPNTRPLEIFSFKHRLQNTNDIEESMLSIKPTGPPTSEIKNSERNKINCNETNVIHPILNTSASKKYQERKNEPNIQEANNDKTDKNKLELLVDQNVDWHIHEKVRNVVPTKQSDKLTNKVMHNDCETNAIDTIINRANNLLANTTVPLKSQPVKNTIEDEIQRINKNTFTKIENDPIYIEKKSETLNKPPEIVPNQFWHIQSIFKNQEKNSQLAPAPKKELLKTDNTDKKCSYIKKIEPSITDSPKLSSKNMKSEDKEFQEILCCKFNITPNEINDKSEANHGELENKQYELRLTLSECKLDNELKLNEQTPTKTQNEPKTNKEAVQNDSTSRSIKENKPTHDRIRNFTTCAYQKDKPSICKLEKPNKSINTYFTKQDANFTVPKSDTISKPMIFKQNNSSSQSTNVDNLEDSFEMLKQIRSRYMNRCTAVMWENNKKYNYKENKKVPLQIKNFEKDLVINDNIKQKNDIKNEYLPQLKPTLQNKETINMNYGTKETKNDLLHINNHEKDERNYIKNVSNEYIPYIKGNDLKKKQRIVYKTGKSKSTLKVKKTIKKSGNQYIVDSFMLNRFMQLIKRDLFKDVRTHRKEEHCKNVIIQPNEKSEEKTTTQCNNDKVWDTFPCQKGNKKLKMEVPSQLPTEEEESLEYLRSMLSYKAEEFCNVMIELIKLFSTYTTSNEILKQENALKFIKSHQDRINNLKDTIKNLQYSIDKYFKKSGSPHNCLAHGDTTCACNHSCDMLYSHGHDMQKHVHCTPRKLISSKSDLPLLNDNHYTLSNTSINLRPEACHEFEFRQTLMDLICTLPLSGEKGTKRHLINDNI